MKIGNVIKNFMISKGKVLSVFIVSACGKIVEQAYMLLLLRAIDFKKYEITLHIMLIVVRQICYI